MSNVHHLPDPMQRQWRVFDETLREIMQTEAYVPDEIAHVCEQLKPVYLRYAAGKSFCTSKGGETVVQELNDWIHGQITGLLVELAAREVELYRLRGSKP